MTKRPKTTRTLLALLLASVAFSGCSQKKPVIKLGEIYNRSAKSHPIDRHPVILIPGIQGSRLVDSETDTVVWGAFGNVGLNPNTPQGLDLFSVPMKIGAPLNELSDSIEEKRAFVKKEIEERYGIPGYLKFSSFCPLQQSA